MGHNVISKIMNLNQYSSRYLFVFTLSRGKEHELDQVVIFTKSYDKLIKCASSY